MEGMYGRHRLRVIYSSLNVVKSLVPYHYCNDYHFVKVVLSIISIPFHVPTNIFREVKPVFSTAGKFPKIV